MAVAAVPRYLGENFTGASPGMRFGLYLPVWASRKDQERQVRERARRRSREGQELDQFLRNNGMEATIAEWTGRERNPIPSLWEKDRDGANDAWGKVVRLSPNDRRCLDALGRRQAETAAALEPGGAFLTVGAISVSPFTTGLGNEHPLENGFAFLNPYGLPYLPGSGVKGVVRQSARELAGLARGARWGLQSEWSAEVIEALLGKEVEERTHHQRGALCFWDVVPEIKGGALLVEVMTPHQKHYYQDGHPPHESGQPIPISFLTVPPGSRFTFRVRCDRPLLRRLAPELADDEHWQTLLREAFEHAFEWLGFGAKTTVGYGALVTSREGGEVDRSEQERRDKESQRRAAEAAKAKRRLAELEALPENERALRRFAEAIGAISMKPPLNKDLYAQLMGHVHELANATQGWEDPPARGQAAEAIEAAFERFGWAPSGLRPEKRRKQEKKRRELVARLRG